MDIMQGLQSILGQAMPGGGDQSQANAGTGLGGLAGLLNPEVLGNLANSLFAGKSGRTGSLGLTAGASGAGGLGGLIGSLLGGAPTPGLDQAHSEMTQAGKTNSMFGAAPDPKAKAGRLIRALIYAAKADGHIDEREQAAINSQLARANVGPEGQELIRRAMEEPLDPNRVASGVSDSREALQLYALSSAICNADQFMERGYLDKLADALRIPADVKASVEAQLRG